VNRDLSLLRALFRWAANRGYCHRNPVADVQRFQENAPRDCCLSLDEANRLIAAADPEVRPAILLAIGTGMRRGEQLSLRWRDVNLYVATIRIAPENDKVRTGREVPLSAPVLEAVRGFAARRRVPQLDGSDLVCVRHDGRPIRPEWLRTRFFAAARAPASPRTASRSGGTTCGASRRRSCSTPGARCRTCPACSGTEP